ncbi:hypothetical protein BH09MYX1_BH09MYX1_00920 [soil metagenome]
MRKASAVRRGWAGEALRETEPSRPGISEASPAPSFTLRFRAGRGAFFFAASSSVPSRDDEAAATSKDADSSHRSTIRLEMTTVTAFRGCERPCAHARTALGQRPLGRVRPAGPSTSPSATQRRASGPRALRAQPNSRGTIAPAKLSPAVSQLRARLSSVCPRRLSDPLSLLRRSRYRRARDRRDVGAFSNAIEVRT